MSSASSLSLSSVTLPWVSSAATPPVESGSLSSQTPFGSSSLASSLAATTQPHLTPASETVPASPASVATSGSTTPVPVGPETSVTPVSELSVSSVAESVSSSVSRSDVEVSSAGSTDVPSPTVPVVTTNTVSTAPSVSSEGLSSQAPFVTPTSSSLSCEECGNDEVCRSMYGCDIEVTTRVTVSTFAPSSSATPIGVTTHDSSSDVTVSTSQVSDYSISSGSLVTSVPVSTFATSRTPVPSGNSTSYGYSSATVSSYEGAGNKHSFSKLTLALIMLFVGVRV
ncbi:hypothetical protein OXX59_009173 [Metschnikowia pulcherrima]